MARDDQPCPLVGVLTLAGVLLVALPGPVVAQTQQFTFTGVVGSAPAPLSPPFDHVQAGDPWTLQYCVDLATPDTNPDPTLGQYNDALTNVVFTVGGVSQAGVLNGLNMIQLQDNFLQVIITSDRYTVWFELPGSVICKLDASAIHLGIDPLPFLHSDLLRPCEAFPIFPHPPELTIYNIDATPAILAETGLPSCGECVVPECLLVIGPAGTGATVTAIGHEFATQVGGVEQIWPVSLEDGPAFVVWSPPLGRRLRPVAQAPVGPGPTGSTGGQAGHGHGSALPLESPPPPTVFAAQVLMWNPQSFPANPEQFTHGLTISVFPNGDVVSVPYGASDGGMEIWAETSWNDQGQKVLRLPFSIPGF